MMESISGFARHKSFPLVFTRFDVTESLKDDPTITMQNQQHRTIIHLAVGLWEERVHWRGYSSCKIQRQWPRGVGSCVRLCVAVSLMMVGV